MLTVCRTQTERSLFNHSITQTLQVLDPYVSNCQLTLCASFGMELIIGTMIALLSMSARELQPQGAKALIHGDDYI